MSIKSKNIIKNDEQRKRSQITSAFLKGAPSGFRQDMNDAYRSGLWAVDMSCIKEEYVSWNILKKTMHRLKSNIANVMRNGETGKWCDIITDEKIIRHVLIESLKTRGDPKITFKDVISFVWGERKKMDGEAIKCMLSSLSELLNFKSRNIIIGDKITRVSEDIRANHVFVQVHLIQDSSSEDFQKRVASARERNVDTNLTDDLDGGVNVILQFRFDASISVREACKRIKESKEWEHPDVKGFSSSNAFSLCFDDGGNRKRCPYHHCESDCMKHLPYDSVMSMDDLLAGSFFSNNDKMVDHKGSIVKTRKSKGSGMDNVVHLSAFPSTSKWIQRDLSLDITLKCNDCNEYNSSVWADKPIHYDSLCQQIYNSCTHMSFSGFFRCKSCVSKVRFIEMDGTCTSCLKTGKNYFGYAKGFKTVVTDSKTHAHATCRKCMYNIQTPSLDLCKRNSMGDAMQTGRAMKRAEVIANEKRAVPDVLFNPEHAKTRKRKFGFETSFALG